MTLGEVLGDIRDPRPGASTARTPGVDLVQDCAARIDAVRLAVRGAAPEARRRARVARPVFSAGHWVPQMIEYAGGFDLLALPGERSEVVEWDQVKGAEPEVIIVMPCGYDAERAQEEAYTYGDELEEVGADQVVAVDASGLFSRPAPPARRRARGPRPHPPPRSRARAAVGAADRRALSVLFVHSSAGRYGADRQLALLAQPQDTVLLPFDGPLVEDLRCDVVIGPVPVLRRELLSPKGDGAAGSGLWCASSRGSRGCCASGSRTSCTPTRP